MTSSQTCREKHAVPLLEPQRLVTSTRFQSALSICTEKHLERVFHAGEGKFLSYLNSFCLKIFTSAKHFSGAPIEITDEAWFLTGVSNGIHIENLHRLAKMKLSEVSILISPVVVIEPIGQIGILLNLCKQDPLFNCMNIPASMRNTSPL